MIIFLFALGDRYIEVTKCTITCKENFKINLHKNVGIIASFNMDF